MKKKTKATSHDSFNHLSQGTLEGILRRDEIGLPCAELTTAAKRVLAARYLLRDENGHVKETPRELFERVAKAVASVEHGYETIPETLESLNVDVSNENPKLTDLKHSKKNLHKNLGRNQSERTKEITKKFFDLIANLKFLPNSPTLMNAGREHGQLSACFVLPIEDDLERIFQVLKETAIIQRSGGGTGFSFGQIRPRGDFIGNLSGRSTGAVEIIKIFDFVTSIIKQGATRRGANMAILPCTSPDIDEFVNSKVDGTLENFNISVGVTDDFFTAIKNNKPWQLFNSRTKQVEKTISARKLWKKIIHAAWSCGDPGLVFIDSINKENPTPDIGAITATNPCGEQPLLSYESCNLGSMNLLHYATESGLNWDELEKDIYWAIRFLDNIIEVNYYPVPEIEKITKRNRKIGLGVMGWADCLLKWKVPYDSVAALELASSTMKKFNDVALLASQKLAQERGAFPGFETSLWAQRGQAKRRNATVTTIAPTGTISIIAGVSSGIEPVFSLAYQREALDGQRLVFVHSELKELLRKNKIKARKIVWNIIGTGSLQNIPEDIPGITKAIKKIFKTAQEISPIHHLKMQSAFQKYTENAVSKTINLRHNAGEKEVGRIFKQAYELGCKGITVYRDKSKSRQVLTHGAYGEKEHLLESIKSLLSEQEDSAQKQKAALELAAYSRKRIKSSGKHK